MTPSLPHIAPLRTIGWIAAGSIAAGGVMHFILFGGTFEFSEVMITLGISTGYVALIGTSLQISSLLLVRRVPLESRRAFIIHAVVQAVITLLMLLLTSWLVGLVTGFTFMYNRGTMVVIGLVSLCGALIGHGAYYLASFYRRMREAEHAAMRAELGALRAQVNPHFLFNSLNSIAALIRIDPAQAEHVTESLADLFRYSLRSSHHPTVTLQEEVGSVELYLAIEQARFRDRLRITIDVPEELRDARVPSLLLQPLVENGVKHGAGRTEGICDVAIAASRRENRLLLRITDTGPGFESTDPDLLATRGTGLANVRERLRIMFGKSGEMKILPNGVELLFPYQPKTEGMETQGTERGKAPMPGAQISQPDTKKRSDTRKQSDTEKKSNTREKSDTKKKRRER